MVYKLEGDELNEYRDVIETFAEKVAKIFYRGLRKIIENPNTKVPITINSVLNAVDNELLNGVAPNIVAKVDKMLAEDTELISKNKLISNTFDKMTEAEKLQAIDDFNNNQEKLAEDICNSTENKRVVDELANIFSQKIDPSTGN